MESSSIKFWSFQHLIIIATSILVGLFFLSDDPMNKFMGYFLLMYGLGIINYRLIQIMKKD